MRKGLLTNKLFQILNLLRLDRKCINSKQFKLVKDSTIITESYSTWVGPQLKMAQPPVRLCGAGSFIANYLSFFY